MLPAPRTPPPVNPPDLPVSPHVECSKLLFYKGISGLKELKSLKELEPIKPRSRAFGFINKKNVVSSSHFFAVREA